MIIATNKMILLVEKAIENKQVILNNKNIHKINHIILDLYPMIKGNNTLI